MTPLYAAAHKHTLIHSLQISVILNMLHPLSYLCTPDVQIRALIMNMAHVKLNGPVGSRGLGNSCVAFADTSLKIHDPENRPCRRGCGKQRVPLTPFPRSRNIHNH